MVTFYFIAGLFLFQVFYWIALSRLYFSDYAYINSIADWVLYSGFGWPTRILLVGYVAFFSGNGLKNRMGNFFNGKWLFVLSFWMVAALGFICFEYLPLGKGYKEWLFLILLAISCMPFFLPNRHKPSIKEDKIKLKSPRKFNSHSLFSIALPTKNGLLPINNPQRGICIMGNAGSGKTRYILEPILYAMIKKGYCGLVYDYYFEGNPVAPKKNYCLSKFVYNCYLQLSDRKKISFNVINFTDPNKSVRINPIHPAYLENRAFLEEYVTVLLNNLNPDKKNDFWHLSTKSLLKGIIVFLANNAKSCCTLPHVLTLVTKPIDQVLALIEQDKEAYGYASSIFDAAKAGEKAAGQLVGIIAGFKASLQLLINKELFWALSAHEIPLNINDGASPMLLCIGNFPSAKSAFSPVIALLITVCFRSMYGHGKTKSFVAIDELPTLYIPNLAELPATARKYGIATIAAIQSGAQLEKTYTLVGAKEIQENLSNQFIGNCGVYSAGYGSSIFGKESCFVHSTTASTAYPENKGTHQTIGESISMHERDSIKAQSFAALEVGCFTGRVVESDRVFFQEQFKHVAAYDKHFSNEQLKEIPDIKQVSQEDVIANQRKIEEEVDLLLSSMHMPH